MKDTTKIVSSFSFTQTLRDEQNTVNPCMHEKNQHKVAMISEVSAGQASREEEDNFRRQAFQ